MINEEILPKYVYPKIEGCHPILALKLLNSLILTQIIQHTVYNCVASIQMGHETDNRGSLVGVRVLILI